MIYGPWENLSVMTQLWLWEFAEIRVIRFKDFWCNMFLSDSVSHVVIGQTPGNIWIN